MKDETSGMHIKSLKCILYLSGLKSKVYTFSTEDNHESKRALI